MRLLAHINMAGFPSMLSSQAFYYGAVVPGQDHLLEQSSVYSLYDPYLSSTVSSCSSVCSRF